MVEKRIHWAEHVFLIGPDPIDPKEPRSLWNTILPWPVRLVLVLAALLVGRLAANTGLGKGLGAALQYGGLVAVSMAASNWWILFVVNSSLALAWWGLGGVPRDLSSFSAKLAHAITFLNRQVGHIELLAAWWTIALACTQDLRWQLPLAAAALVLWEPLVNGIGSLRPFREPGRKNERPPKHDGSLFWARRPVIYATTLLGQILIALWAVKQMNKLLPLMLAVVLPDLIRYLCHRWRRRAALGEGEKQRRLAMRVTQRRIGRHADAWLGSGLVAGGMALALLLSWQARGAWAKTVQQILGSAGVPAEICEPRAAEPPSELAVFLIADNHWHELGGQRFPGQLDFADALVPWARRPVELDILSVAPVLRFASVYRTLAQQEAAAGRTLFWAHLGDLADLGCINELERASKALAEGFPPQAFIGVAPGNHDKAFTGNFLWSPYWDKACASGRLEKVISDRRLRLDWHRAVEAQGGRMEPVAGGELYAWLTGRGSALASVTPLGVVHHQGQARGLLALFIDTGDERGRDYGIAGQFGTLSEAQVDKLLDLRTRVATAQKNAIFQQAPLYLIVGHSPIGALTSKARGQLNRLVSKLDDGQGPRVVAYVAAHTHSKAATAECLAGRRVPEIVIGSTIDPPQEAAILRVGPDGSGTLTVRVRALGLVADEARACGAEPTVAASECSALVASWQHGSPCCADLFRRSDGAPGAACQSFEKVVSTAARLKMAAQSTAQPDEQEILVEQKRQARALLSCLMPTPSCAVADDLLSFNDESITAFLKRVAATAEGEKALACLSWAAAAMQAHKGSSMEIADALRCAFTDPTVPGPCEYVAPLALVPCR